MICDANLGNASGSLSFGGGGLTFLSGGPSPFTTNRTITLNTGGGNFDTSGNSATLNGLIKGTGFLVKSGLNTLTLTHTNTYSGGTFVDQGILDLTAAGAAGTSAIEFGNTYGSTLQMRTPCSPRTTSPTRSRTSTALT